jgi:valyl-tRNA synthetase
MKNNMGVLRMTKQEIKLAKEMIHKVLTEKKSLTTEESNKLSQLLKKLEGALEESKKDEKESLSQTMEKSLLVSMSKDALKHTEMLAEKERFSKATPAQKKAYLDDKIKKLESFFEGSIKKLEAETEQLNAKREEAEYYAEYEKKYGYEI